MAKKQSPEHRLKNEIVRTYRDRFNSSSELSKALGVSKKTAQNYLDKIAAGESPVKDAGRANELLDNLKNAPGYFSGEGEMSLIHERTGKQYQWESYKIEPGKSLPSSDVTDRAYAYQIIIDGKIKGQSRKITTTWAGTPEDALSEARAMMSQYFRFTASSFELSVIAEYEGEEA